MLLKVNSVSSCPLVQRVRLQKNGFPWKQFQFCAVDSMSCAGRPNDTPFSADSRINMRIQGTGPESTLITLWTVMRVHSLKVSDDLFKCRNLTERLAPDCWIWLCGSWQGLIQNNYPSLRLKRGRDCCRIRGLAVDKISDMAPLKTVIRLLNFAFGSRSALVVWTREFRWHLAFATHGNALWDWAIYCWRLKGEGKTGVYSCVNCPSLTTTLAHRRKETLERSRLGVNYAGSKRTTGEFLSVLAGGGNSLNANQFKNYES